MSTPFDDLDSYIALPRTSGLALSRDGRRLVVGVARLDEDRTSHVTSLWEIDPEGAAPARQLTRGLSSEGSPAFTAAGDLLFVAKRPAAGEEKETAAVWCLPATGGEAFRIARRPGGVSAVTTAEASDHVLVTAATLPSATDAASERDLREAREKNKVNAILHADYPVRFWDHDLGPDAPHLFHGALSVLEPAEPADGLTATGADADAGPDTTVAAATREPGGPEGTLIELTDLTPAPGRALVEHGHDLSPDGHTAVTSWRVPAGRGAVREELRVVEVATGEQRVLATDPDADLFAPAISPDGTRVAYLRSTHSDPATAPRTELWVIGLDGGDARCLTGDWELWPGAPVWLPDGSGLLTATDANGRAPLFHIPLTGPIRQVTSDDAAYSDVVPHPDGTRAYALRASYAGPPAPVRIDLATGEVTALPAPHAQPELPGTLTEVTTTTADGTTIRSWLALPAGADAEKPAPLLLWIHGGPLNSWNSWSWRWCPWLLVAEGYAVLLPDPALSTGYGQEFIQRGWGEWGGAPYTDLMAATDAAIALPEIDADRTAAMGGSFGGYMANWIAGHTDRFRAIVTHASLWNLDGFAAATDAAWFWNREMTPEMSAANSPHRHVAEIVTPMLVIHGDKDYRVPITEGLQLWYQLLADSRLPAAEDGTTDHRFLYFPEENHWVLSPQHAKLWYQVVIGFLGEHLLGRAPERPELLG